MSSEDQPWTRVAAHGVCVDEDRVLLVRIAPPFPRAGAWTLPGGGLDWGEPPEIGVVREFQEETGLHVETASLLGVYSETYLRQPDEPYDSVHYLSVVFEIRPVGGELRNELDGSTDTAAWYGRDAVDGLEKIGVADFGIDLFERRR